MRFGVFGLSGACFILAFGAGCGALSAAANLGATTAGAEESTETARVRSVEAARALTREPLPAAVAWSFRSGAPLAAPPGIGPDGEVVVGSVDGYLHALRGDGSFRWGYTLRGPIVGRPAVGENGIVFAAADPNGLYALDGDGTLLWVSSVSGGVRSPAVLDRDSHVWITTGQGTLLGYSHHGGLVGFARVDSARTLGPAPLPEGGVAVVSIDGSVRVAGHRGVVSDAGSSAPLRELDAGGDGLFVLGAGGLARLDAGGEERWSRASVTGLACSSPGLVVVEGAGLSWLSREGEPRAVVALPARPTRAIACLEDGSVLLADDSGIVVRVAPRGVVARAGIPKGRLLSLDSLRSGLVVAGYRDGRVLAFTPPG
jgi:outer membrane protein assembly factor BamB